MKSYTEMIPIMLPTLLLVLLLVYEVTTYRRRNRERTRRFLGIKTHVLHRLENLYNVESDVLTKENLYKTYRQIQSLPYSEDGLEQISVILNRLT